MNTFQRLGACLAICLLGMGAALAQTEAWPPKTVRLVSPYPPGGTADIIARQLANKLGTRLGASFVVENKPGAGGNIASEYVARAPADGSVLLIGVTGPIAINPALYRKMAVQPAQDLKALNFIAAEPFLLVVHPSLKVNDVAGLVNLAKARPGGLTFASGGSGSATHLAAELFRTASQTQIVHVPYKGGVPALTDVLSGVVPFMFTSLAAVQHIQTGKLVGLAVTGATRSSMVPNVPTLREAGVNGAESTIWYGLFAAATLPAPVLGRIHAEVQTALQDPEVQKTLRDLGMTTSDGSAEAFQQFVREETTRWTAVVRATGATAD